MSERRCEHGFLRSVVPCPVCNPGVSVRAAVRAEGLTRPKPTQRRLRGQGEVITREGSYRCRACGVTKKLSEFYLSRSSRLGHQSRCKPCDNDKRTKRVHRERGYV